MQPFLVRLFPHSFFTLCENSRPRSFKVRSPAKVKWTGVPKHPNLRPSYNTWRIDLKLLVLDKSDYTYQMFHSGFWYSWLRSGQICDLHITYKPMGKIPTALVCQSLHSIHSQLCLRLKTEAIFLTSDLCNMQFRSYGVIRGHHQLLKTYFWLEWAKGFKAPTMRSACSNESTDM